MDQPEPSSKPEVELPAPGDETLPPPPTFSAQPSVHRMFGGPDGLHPGWRVFLYLGMGVLVFLILSNGQFLIPERGAGYLWRTLFIQVVLVLSSVLPAVVMARVEDRPFSNYGLPIWGLLRRNFWIGLLWGVVALSALMVLMRMAGVFDFGTLRLHGGRVLEFAVFWGLFFFLVGIFEEFTFRGYTQFTLAQWIGFWPAAILLSFLFGLLHLLGNIGETWIGSLCAAVIGLFFCLTLKRTTGLWFAVGMHACWDWSESYLYSVPDSGGTTPGRLLNSSFHGSRWLTGGTVGPEGSVLVFVVIAVAWVAFDRIYPARRRADFPSIGTGEDARPA